MTTNSSPVEIVALAERCEAATGPDIDLDLDISEMTGGWKALATWKGVSFTASLDAALTLVPEGWFLWDFHQNALNERWYCRAHWHPHGDDIKTVEAIFCSTPALALCAAALRARAASE